jgi:hypothetical protein
MRLISTGEAERRQSRLTADCSSKISPSIFFLFAALWHEKEKDRYMPDDEFVSSSGARPF